MPDTPNYGFNRHPRFSANQLADYLAAGNANQRERIIRSAKFPKKVRVVAYRPAKRIICDFLAGNTGDLSYLDDQIRRLDTRRRREPEGWMRDEMKRCIEAVREFRRTYSKRRLGRYHFGIGPVDLGMKLDGMRINTRLDVSVNDTARDGTVYSGGCILFLANTDAARRNIESRRSSVAALVHWCLEGGNIEPLPRLCLSFDVFGEAVARAPQAIDRLRNSIESSCAEAVARWDRVQPPADYDGPNWR